MLTPAQRIAELNVQIAVLQARDAEDHERAHKISPPRNNTLPSTSTSSEELVIPSTPLRLRAYDGLGSFTVKLDRDPQSPWSHDLDDGEGQGRR